MSLYNLTPKEQREIEEAWPGFLARLSQFAQVMSKLTEEERQVIFDHFGVPQVLDLPRLLEEN